MYNIIIGPIEYVMSKLYNAFNMHPCMRLLVLSVFVNFISTPLYNRAIDLQEKSIKQKQTMAPWIKRIKKTFSGDERVLMLNAYNKIAGRTLKDEISIISSFLVQIPFFMAAYELLLKPGSLEGGFYSLPDQLIALGTIKINILPILMTTISILSGIVYSSEMPWKQKWSVMVLPCVFLVILYDSPAGLVLYWTFNTIISLTRNIYQKINKKKNADVKKNEKKFPEFLIILLIAFIYAHRVLTSPIGNWDTYTKIGPFFLALISVIPMFSSKIYNTLVNKRVFSLKEIFLREAFLIVFISFFLTSSLVASSPSDFYAVSSSLMSLFNKPVLMLTGAVFLWFNIYTFIMTENKRQTVYGILAFFCFVVVLDHIIWGNHYGIMTIDLHYERNPFYSDIGIISSFVIIILLYIIYNNFFVKFQKFENSIISIMLLSVLAASIYNCIQIKKSYIDEPVIAEVIPDKPFRLNPGKKNVIVIMLDRAIGAYIPYIFADKPELYVQYDGFTYYSNTVTTGICTAIGAPGLFGGYEYAGSELIKDIGKPISERHIESLEVLPTLFGNNGYYSILSSLPYAGYKNTSDMTMFENSKNTDAYNLEFSYAISENLNSNNWDFSEALLSYALYKASPYFAQGTMYYIVCEGYKDNPEFTPFPRSYNILDNLPEMTEITDASDYPYLIELNNNATHEPVYLRYPNYTYSEDAEEYNQEYIKNHPEYASKMENITGSLYLKKNYQSNACAIKLLGEWFAYLKECGVYDNTRIIIASDHGYPYRDFEDLIINEKSDAEAMNCLLMYKDFDSHGFNTDNQLMTNADCPGLAVKDLIPDAKNPYTGEPIKLLSNKEEVVSVESYLWFLIRGNAYDYDRIYKITGDSSNLDNYTVIDNQ